MIPKKIVFLLVLLTSLTSLNNDLWSAIIDDFNDSPPVSLLFGENDTDVTTMVPNLNARRTTILSMADGSADINFGGVDSVVAVTGGGDDPSVMLELQYDQFNNNTGPANLLDVPANDSFHLPLASDSGATLNVFEIFVQDMDNDMDSVSLGPVTIPVAGTNNLFVDFSLFDSAIDFDQITNVNLRLLKGAQVRIINWIGWPPR